MRDGAQHTCGSTLAVHAAGVGIINRPRCTDIESWDDHESSSGPSISGVPALWKLEISQVSGAGGRRSAWGLGMRPPLRAVACARAEPTHSELPTSRRARAVGPVLYGPSRDRAYHSHATVHTRPLPTAGANQDRSPLNRHARCVPRRRAPPGGLSSAAVRSIDVVQTK